MIGISLILVGCLCNITAQGLQEIEAILAESEHDYSL